MGLGNGRISVRSAALGGAALAALLSGSSVASAADAPDKGVAAVSEVVVTASRAATAGFEAPTPTTVIGSDVIEQRAATNVITVLSEMPSFKSSRTPAANGAGIALPGASFVDLRGLGTVRSLVLIDGRRFPPTVPSSNATAPYQIDMNQIPALLVDRIEVVTGGASAQWGSDAITGVVNIGLKKNIEGILGEVQGGLADQHDNFSFRLGLAYGRSFADGRGHFQIGFDYAHNDGIKGDALTRDWGRKQIYAIATGLPASSGFPKNVILPDVQFAAMTPGGIIVSVVNGAPASLVGLQFNPGGSTSTFLRGAVAGPGSPTVGPTATFQVGGGNVGVSAPTTLTLLPSAWRRIGLIRASYDVTPDVNVYGQVQYGFVDSRSHTISPRDQGAATAAGIAGTNATIGIPTIFKDNAFLPANIAAAMASAPANAGFRLGRYDTDLSRPLIHILDRTSQVVIGADGRFGETWRWDGFYSHGQNGYHLNVYNFRNKANYANATDAILSNGKVICRSTLTTPNNGCVPLNLFGSGAPSKEAVDYVTGHQYSNAIFRQDNAAFNLKGELFHTWAGPINAATGIEWRHEHQAVDVDAISQVNGFESGGLLPYSGSFTVTEAYFEAIAPLARNLVLAKSIDVDGAVRVAKYNGPAGTQTTWKIGGTWQPGGGLLFRIARSHDIRAPNIFEQRLPGLSQLLNVTFRAPLGNGSTVATTVTSTGNANLLPETSDTLTVGGSYNPTFLSGLKISADYYDIKVKDVIGALGQQVVVDQCALGRQEYCRFLTINNGVLAAVQNPFVNATSLAQRGWEYAASYSSDLSRFSLPGRVSARFAADNVQHVYFQAPGAVRVDRAGQLDGTGFAMPNWVWNATLAYDVGRFNGSVQVRHIGKGKYQNQNADGSMVTDLSDAPSGVQADYNTNRVPGVSYVNLQASYSLKADDRVQIFAVVNNLLDKDPPAVPNTGGFQAANGAYYDVIGRSYQGGVRFKF